MYRPSDGNVIHQLIAHYLWFLFLFLTFGHEITSHTLESTRMTWTKSSTGCGPRFPVINLPFFLSSLVKEKSKQILNLEKIYLFVSGVVPVCLPLGLYRSVVHTAFARHMARKIFSHEKKGTETTRAYTAVHAAAAACWYNSCTESNTASSTRRLFFTGHSRSQQQIFTASRLHACSSKAA